MKTPFPALDALAQSKLPPEKRNGFVVSQMEVLECGGILLTGCYPRRSYTKGPRKGRPDFRRGGDRLTVSVTEHEYKEAFAV